tara:strand:+ start:4643 stop:4843 length:201 start_codon:yes stop_codon:yes gene_type:complete
MREKGSAGISITLHDGVMYVHHEDGTLLHQRDAWHGEWNELWQFIRRPFPPNLRGITVSREEAGLE